MVWVKGYEARGDRRTPTQATGIGSPEPTRRGSLAGFLKERLNGEAVDVSGRAEGPERGD